jgi:D-3-phosphoglycerate dehydrogenase
VRVTILDDYFDTLRTLPGFSKLKDFEVVVWNDHVSDQRTLAERLQATDAVVLFRERTSITGELVRLLPKLRLISMRGAYPHVDVEACTQAGVLVSSGQAGATPHPTAELTMGLILAAMRQIPQQMASLQNGTWQAAVGRSLNGLTIGLYGYGRIGRAVAALANAFGMNVQWWASGEGRQRALDKGARVAESRRAFFSESDVVSLHIRLHPETRGVVTGRDLALMGPRSLLVNTSRSGLIEEGALLSGLEAGHPGFGAIDVWESEPVDSDDPLANHPNVVGTPHIGFVTEDELDRQFNGIYDQVVAYAAGSPTNVINPEALH